MNKLERGEKNPNANRQLWFFFENEKIENYIKMKE